MELSNSNFAETQEYNLRIFGFWVQEKQDSTTVWKSLKDLRYSTQYIHFV